MALINEFRKQGDFLFKNRSYFPLLIIVVAIIVDAYIYYYHLSNPYGPTENYYQFIAVVLCLFGLFIRIFTVGFSPDGTSGRNTKEGQVASVLNTTGAYSMLRHPLYLGNFFMWFGVAFWVKDFWFIIAFIFLYTLYYERIMYAEEAFLIQKFNNQYTAWSSKTQQSFPLLKITKDRIIHFPF
ncbi:methyltransferase family protein [Galbibacter sp.]|uniref:methyltransferase family protein n=1 Tax=Galbibacter sp. TaxID=2918471 RepID=UPI003A8FD97E